MFLVASMVSPSSHPPARDVYFGAMEDAHPRSRARDVFGLYLREAGRHPPLRASEEKRLARTLRQSRAEIHSSSVPRQAALRRYQGARTRLIERNLRLVIAVARRYAHLGMDFSDLVQEGNLGLMLAVERFDPERGVRFSTYAVWWIRQAITHSPALKNLIVSLSLEPGPFS